MSKQVKNPNRAAVYLKPQNQARLEQAVKVQQVSRSKIINEALTQYFSKTKPAT